MFRIFFQPEIVMGLEAVNNIVHRHLDEIVTDDGRKKFEASINEWFVKYVCIDVFRGQQKSLNENLHKAKFIIAVNDEMVHVYVNDLMSDFLKVFNVRFPSLMINRELKK